MEENIQRELNVDKEDINDAILDVNLPDESELTQFMSHYRQVIILYESAIQYVIMRLDLINRECETQRKCSPIRSVSSRIKDFRSINRKLKTRELPLTIRSIFENLNDVAGVRIICEYIFDIYAVRDALLSDGQIELVQEKDYIEHPKANGYRSLHLIVNVPLPMREGTRIVRCEIQLRTTAMDSWAALEHNLRYKKDRTYDADIDYELRECAAMLAETDMKMQRIAEKMERSPSILNIKFGTNENHSGQ